MVWFFTEVRIVHSPASSCASAAKTVLTSSRIAIFHPLLPYASKYRVRLVFVNMRGFPGSSEFSQEELNALGSTDPDVQTAATHAVGQNIALCLQHLIRTLALPPITESEGKRTGGVALLGWSLGNFPTLAMLASGHQLSDETRDILGRYLRTVVMYGE